MVFFLFLLLLGLSVGSFLNCLVYRLNSFTSPRKNPSGLKFSTRRVGELARFSLVSGRSFCPKCKHQLVWHDLIPLLSFVLLKGKCRYCRKPISWQYPIVELATGLTTVLIFSLSNYELRIASYNLLISYCLIAVFVSDLKYQIIPDQVVYPAIVVSLPYLIIYHLSFIIYHLVSGLGAAGFFLLLYFVTKKKGMGLGDVKLAALMGLILGWPKILLALYFAFLTGALVGVILILTGKKKFGQHIPFGPFLVAGTFVSLFWGEKILGYLSHLGYL